MLEVSFLTKLQVLRPETCNFIKKRLWQRCFPVNFPISLRIPFYRAPPGDCLWTSLVLFYNPISLTILFSSYICLSRSSHPEVFCHKGVLKNSPKFIRKHLCESLFFNKVAGTACNFINIRIKETMAQVLYESMF